MKMKSKQIYTFLGLPASGKGTQAELFARKRGLKIIGIGDLVRNKLAEGDHNDPFIAEIKDRYEQGIPQPDEVAFDLARDELERLESGVVFDNFPFTLNQAKFLDKYIAEHNLA